MQNLKNEWAIYDTQITRFCAKNEYQENLQMIAMRKPFFYIFRIWILWHIVSTGACDCDDGFIGEDCSGLGPPSIPDTTPVTCDSCTEDCSGVTINGAFTDVSTMTCRLTAYQVGMDSTLSKLIIENVLVLLHVSVIILRSKNNHYLIKEMLHKFPFFLSLIILTIYRLAEHVVWWYCLIS